MLFCSTHPTEKVWRQIYIEEKLLFQVRYYVVPKCGTTNQMGGGGGSFPEAWKRSSVSICFRSLTLGIKVLLKLPKSHKQVHIYNLSGNMVANYLTWPICVKSQLFFPIVAHLNSCYQSIYN